MSSPSEGPVAGGRTAGDAISPGMVDTRSFPKAPGRSGVRPADFSALGIDLLLREDAHDHGDQKDGAEERKGEENEGSRGRDSTMGESPRRRNGVTGHYVHVDELDAAIAAGKAPQTALKPIDEPPFVP